MELRYEDGWLLEMDADAGVYDVYDEKRCLSYSRLQEISAFCFLARTNVQCSIFAKTSKPLS